MPNKLGIDIFDLGAVACDFADTGVTLMHDAVLAKDIYSRLKTSAPQLADGVETFLERKLTDSKPESETTMGSDFYSHDEFGDEVGADVKAAATKAATPATKATVTPADVNKKIDALVIKIDGLIQASDLWLAASHPLTFKAELDAVKGAVADAKKYRVKLLAGVEQAKANSGYAARWVGVADSIVSLLKECPAAFWKDASIKDILGAAKQLATDIVMILPVAYKVDKAAVSSAIDAGKQALAEFDWKAMAKRAAIVGGAGLGSYLLLNMIFGISTPESDTAGRRILKGVLPPVGALGAAGAAYWFTRSVKDKVQAKARAEKTTTMGSDGVGDNIAYKAGRGIKHLVAGVAAGAGTYGLIRGVQVVDREAVEAEVRRPAQHAYVLDERGEPVLDADGNPMIIANDEPIVVARNYLAPGVAVILGGLAWWLYGKHDDAVITARGG